MSHFGYARTVTVLDGTSASSSSYTSNPLLVSDAQQISVSWTTVGAGASKLTILGSNTDGLTGGSSLAAGAGTPDWSVISTLAAQGIFGVTPGSRWIKIQRSAIDSQASVVINYRAW